MTRKLLFAFVAVGVLSSGAALALDKKPIGVQHADIARAHAALGVLPPDQRVQAEFLLDEAGAAINSRGENGSPERPYNQVVDMVNEVEEMRSVAARP